MSIRPFFDQAQHHKTLEGAGLMLEITALQKIQQCPGARPSPAQYSQQ
jgi:hypothetical protein